MDSDLCSFARFLPPNVRSVAITAPASPAQDSRSADRALDSLARAGVAVRITPDARLGEPGDAYSAIDAAIRARDLEEAWLDPEVQLILPIRGGGGGRELIEALDWERLAQRPDMPVLGFSDLTLLHSAMLARRCGRPIASPMLLDLPLVTADSVQACHDALAGIAPPPYKLIPLQRGKAEGLLFGAHLQRLASLLGSPFKADLTGRIVFLECPHRSEKQIAPIFQSLVRSGALDGVAAIVFGSFPDCTSPEAERRMLEDFAGQASCPVFMGFPFGHTPRLHAIDSAATGTIDSDGVLSIRPAPPVR